MSVSQQQSPSSDNALWVTFTDASNDVGFYQAWLGLLSLRISNVVRAVLILTDSEDGHFKPVAYWPDGQGGSEALADLAEQALEDKQGMAGQLDSQGQCFGVAFPVMVENELFGVVAVETRGSSVSLMLEHVLKQIRWGSGWLETRIRAAAQSSQKEHYQQLSMALDLVVAVLEQKDFSSAVKAAATELADKTGCERVSIGFLKDNNCRIEAISHSAELVRKMNLTQSIAGVMDEACDQGRQLHYPDKEPTSAVVLIRHQELAQQAGVKTILTIPLFVEDEIVGAIVFERIDATGFNEEEISLCGSIGALLSPALHDKRTIDRSVLGIMLDVTEKQLKKLIAPEHYVSKFLLALAAIFVLVIVMVEGEHRIKANAVLEGKIQRSLVAPFDSYIAEAMARAGDHVAKGQVLAKLDDKDLQLERLSSLGEYGQLKKQYDEAMAVRERAKVNIISAQLEQVKAELDRIDDKLLRTRIEAPFNGLVIQGDLSQKLGNAVTRGEQLYVLAPLNQYRVILQVNERDIQYLETGMSGQLVLASLPEQKFQVVVERITPVSESKEGQNYFRVESSLEKNWPQLRPGMEGVAKVDAGTAPLIWIWTHDIVDWIKIALWRWLP